MILIEFFHTEKLHNDDDLDLKLNNPKLKHPLHPKVFDLIHTMDSIELHDNIHRLYAIWLFFDKYTLVSMDFEYAKHKKRLNS